jgi:hypothetical protein
MSLRIPVVFVTCGGGVRSRLPVIGARLGRVVQLLAQRAREDVAMLKFAEKPAVFWCHQSRPRHGAESALFVYRRSEREAETKKARRTSPKCDGRIPAGALSQSSAWNPRGRCEDRVSQRSA